MQLGKKIRNLRKQKNMTLKELATQAGVSISLISQIERDIINPTVDTLWQLSQGLNIHIGFFFDQSTLESDPVVKKANRKKIYLGNSNAVYELLCPDLHGKIEFLQLTLEPGEKANITQITHEGEECGVILQGTLLIILDHQEYLLEEGDSIYFNSTIPHRFINTGKTTSISYWAMTPPSF